MSTSLQIGIHERKSFISVFKYAYNWKITRSRWWRVSKTARTFTQILQLPSTISGSKWGTEKIGTLYIYVNIHLLLKQDKSASPLLYKQLYTMRYDRRQYKLLHKWEYQIQTLSLRYTHLFLHIHYHNIDTKLKDFWR